MANGDKPNPDLETVLAGDTLPDEAVLQRAEEKPPLYRAFRTAMYVGYMIVVVWLVVGIIAGAWGAVWGEQGQQIQAREAATPSSRNDSNKPNH
ncbi:MAG: hypothetical protein HY902_03355 [Deltaproteobacteria bacterium]|nr:hypothetical protein [Deltaproteobacteria bacterium]